MKKVRYGIVGCGRFAEKAVAPAIQASKNSELVALQKRSLQAARERAKDLGVPEAFDSVPALVAHPAVDAVFIASANSAHCGETLLAARAAKHVLVEKPMALNCWEAERMIEACRQNGVKLMVGTMVRLSPLLVRMKNLVASGELGSIVFARADFVYDGRLTHRAWLLDRKVAGGGPVFDIGIHCLDTLRFVLQDEVVTVRSGLDPRPDDFRTESTAHLHLRFGNGAMGSIFCSYRSPVRRTHIEIVGTEGIVSADDFTLGNRTGQLALVRRNGEGPSSTQVESIDVPNLYVEEITQFSDCILHGGEPDLSGLNGLQNQRVLDQAMMAE